MNRKLMVRLLSFTIVLIVAVILVVKNLNQPKAGQRLPNIVFIMADDMGYGDVEALNPDSKIPTPNMNRIAEEGMYF